MEKKDIPHLTTLCYLEQDGKYLMLHRMKKENDLNHGKWIGVGGHFKEGESPEECLLGLQQRKGIKGAIFDVDGTLLDSMGIWRDVGAGYLRLRGREPEKNLNDKLFTMELMGGAAFLKQHYELAETPEEIVEGMIQIVRGRYEREVPLKAGVRELLELFSKQQIPMAAATSSDRSCIEAAFRRLGISNYIPRIFTCREIGTAKTSPVIYEKAREYLGTEREETYVFEDALHALKTVKKAGFVAVGVYEAANEKWQSEIEQSSDIYLKSMKEFEKYL